ncbi:Copia protein, partial [Mucuna pruriens]
MKNTSSYIFQLGKSIISWSFRKQEIVPQSIEKPTIIWCDNQSVVSMAKNLVRDHTIHIKIKYHYPGEAENDGEVSIQHCKSEYQLVDILTKLLLKTKFLHLRKKIELCNKPN